MLIVVLWASLGLVSVALLFGHAMTMTYRGADNDFAGRQAQQAIDGAVRYAGTLLTDATTPGVLPERTEYLNDTIPVGEATFYLLGRNVDASDTTTRAFGLIDESGKINLNIDPTLTGPAQTTALTALATALKKLPGITDDFIDAIVDWQDADDDIYENGAESETYLRFDPAYGCKNAPFESIEELALLNGATRDILYGEDTNLNGVLDDNENDGAESDPPDNADGKLDAGILEYVTVFARESNKYTDSSGTSTARINISNMQQATGPLNALLKEKNIEDQHALQIVQAASAGGPLNSPLQFYIRCKAANVLSEYEFGQLADALTVKDGDYLYGLVNVNTASETVLACLPGMDASKATDLVTARLSRGTLDTNYAWIVGVLDDATANTIGPAITGRSSQVTADVAAVGRHGRGYRREKVIIDQSTGTPQIVYRRNLSGLGWALGSDIREELAQLKKEAAR